MQQASKKNNSLAEFIFYSNYFYGICAIGLSIEATVQQRFPLNDLWYYFLVFITTVLYYTYPYIQKPGAITNNPRTNWYSKHYNLMRGNQVVITIILLISVILFLKDYWNEVWNMSLSNWLLLLIFPVVAAFYYGLDALTGKYNLRKIGWLKPFVIGFIWAGLVNIYPILYYDILNKLDYILTEQAILLFIKNFMFVTVLCIMFDIKDYSVDYINRLKTFVVKLGLRKTIFYILLPLSLLGLVSFIYYAEQHQFNQVKVLLNTIPFILLFAAAWSLRKRRSILYYLVVVDGLMLVKAICGSIAMVYF
ncbi:MAG: hypothetical protein QM737_22035 [Ferruginibacter sp.]